MYKKRNVAVGQTPKSIYQNWDEHREALRQDATEVRSRRRADRSRAN